MIKKNNSQTTFDSLKAFAPAKINLHLEVLGLRKDGFHELAMLMQSIDLFDEIDFTKTNDGMIKLTSNNSELSNEDDNLIIRAAKLLLDSSSKKNLGALIHLKKNIPIGAGLAGGSSDAAATLVGLNTLWGIGLSEQQLEKLAAKLGSDVPFCLAGGTQFCFGRGESLEPYTGKSEMAIVLVKDPSIGVSTPWAYSMYKKKNESCYLTLEEEFEKKRQLLMNSSWLKPLSPLNPPPLKNDLQQVVEPVTPAVRNALDYLSSLKGVLSFAMSGSGPSCFGVFADLKTAKTAFEENRNQLEISGLEGWCCAFRSKGVSLRF